MVLENAKQVSDLKKNWNSSSFQFENCRFFKMSEPIKNKKKKCILNTFPIYRIFLIQEY